MKVKEESEKAGLKIYIQKTKTTASGPITSWQIDGETMETVSDFNFSHFSHSVISDTLQPHARQVPCPSPTRRAYLNSYPLSRWCHPTMSSAVVPFSSCLQFSQHQGLFWCQFFASDGQTIGVSSLASVLPMDIKDGFPLGLTGLISLQSKKLSRVFSNTTVRKHQFFSIQTLQLSCHICTWLLGKI